MNKKKFKRIVDNPRHIPGIHNYCDRWCERCSKTSHCSVYAVEQEKEILAFLVRLERLRRETERTFPKARAFIRPGLDEVN